MSAAQRRSLSILIPLVLMVGLTPAGAAPLDEPPAPTPASPSGVTAMVAERSVLISWSPVNFPAELSEPRIVVMRDGVTIASLPPDAAAYEDGSVAPGERLTYTVAAEATYNAAPVRSLPSEEATVELPDHLVGAAQADITPDGVVNLGGFGLGDGSVIPGEVTDRGRQGSAVDERIQARAMVISDGEETIAIADIETQGMFAAYQSEDVGLSDIATQVAADIPGLPADHILIASDHTHSGPDTIGVWGGPPPGYLDHVKQQTITAIETAYAELRFADIRAGHSEASDLIYNQACTEALNQSKEPDYPGPEVCAVPGKDGEMRVLQATEPDGDVVVTYMAYAAHATAGGGNGIHGDWPQFLSEAMAARYGGIGLAMQGAVGGTQPCRPACAFTDPGNPGYNAPDRKTAYILNYMAHVEDALENSAPVSGPVAAAQTYIREAMTGPFVAALFMGGHRLGVSILRSHDNPWVVGDTVMTVAATLRVGGVVFAGTPGEGFPAIGFGIRDALTDEQEVFQLGLANDQLGYLIAPVEYVPVIAAELPVNDNFFFNVSPTIGDHIMCADIRLALSLGLSGNSPARCAAYDTTDALGDPIASLPVGGVVLP